MRKQESPWHVRPKVQIDYGAVCNGVQQRMLREWEEEIGHSYYEYPIL